MPRDRCYIPRGGALVETCTRTLQGRLLLRPDVDFVEIFFGVLGRALEYAQVELYGLSCLSNHVHLLYWAEHALQMAGFQWYFNGNLAREVARLRDWPEKVWGRRYRPLIVSDEPGAQWGRLSYLLANGTKENLISSPYDWPGIQVPDALVDGKPLEGFWFSRTEEYEARRRGETFEKYDYATKYSVELQKLPAFRHLSDEEYRAKVADEIRVIEERAAAERGDAPVMGATKILLQDPHGRPAHSKKSPAGKLFYAETPESRQKLKDDYAEFDNQYEVAKGLLWLAASKPGPRNPARHFPWGSFPPAMPFVGATMPKCPPPPTRRLDVIELGDETTVLRGPIPVICVPKHGRGPYAAAVSFRMGPARASPALESAAPPT